MIVEPVESEKESRLFPQFSMNRILYTDGTNMSGFHVLPVSFPDRDENGQRTACYDI